jgi:hypothetical protein
MDVGTKELKNKRSVTYRCEVKKLGKLTKNINDFGCSGKDGGVRFSIV